MVREMGWQDERIGVYTVVGEQCVYRISKVDVWILLYVDEVIIVPLKREEVDFFKCCLSEAIDMKDLGSLASFLGVDFT